MICPQTRTASILVIFNFIQTYMRCQLTCNLQDMYPYIHQLMLLNDSVFQSHICHDASLRFTFLKLWMKVEGITYAVGSFSISFSVKCILRWGVFFLFNWYVKVGYKSWKIVSSKLDVAQIIFYQSQAYLSSALCLVSFEMFRCWTKVLWMDVRHMLCR